MLLYSEDSSPWCAPVRAAIYAKGLDIPMAEPPGGFNSAEFKKISITKTIPCLMLDDGSPLPESAVIIAYLDERFPDRPLMPPDPEGRARVALIQRLAENGIVVPIVQFFHDTSDGVADAVPLARERLTTGLERLAPFVADAGYAAGPEFTRADCVLAPAVFGVAAFGPILGDAQMLARHAKLAAYAGRIAGHPAIAKVMAELQGAMAANQAQMPQGVAAAGAGA